LGNLGAKANDNFRRKLFAQQTKLLLLIAYSKSNDSMIRENYEAIEFMHCKFCEKDCNKLVESHIIPQAIFRLIDPNNKLKIYTSVDGQPPKRSRTGIYEKLFCDKCENQFNLLDDHGIKFFKGIFDIIEQNELYDIIKVSDHKLLILFFLSLLLRAHYSKGDIFEIIDIGSKHTQTIKNLIENQKSLIPEYYSVAIFKDPHIKVPIIESARKSKPEGVVYYTFIIGYYTLHIKCDKRCNISLIDEMLFTEKKQIILKTPFDESNKDRIKIAKALRRNSKNLPH
jgi:hypothetical protein